MKNSIKIYFLIVFVTITTIFFAQQQPAPQKAQAGSNEQTAKKIEPTTKRTKVHMQYNAKTGVRKETVTVSEDGAKKSIDAIKPKSK